MSKLKYNNALKDIRSQSLSLIFSTKCAISFEKYPIKSNHKNQTKKSNFFDRTIIIRIISDSSSPTETWKFCHWWKRIIKIFKINMLFLITLYYWPGQHLCTWGFLLLPVLDSGIHGSNDSDSTDSSGKNHASFFLDVLKTLKKNLRRKSRGKYKIAWSI